MKGSGSCLCWVRTNRSKREGSQTQLAFPAFHLLRVPTQFIKQEGLTATQTLQCITQRTRLLKTEGTTDWTGREPHVVPRIHRALFFTVSAEESVENRCQIHTHVDCICLSCGKVWAVLSRSPSQPWCPSWRRWRWATANTRTLTTT